MGRKQHILAVTTESVLAIANKNIGEVKYAENSTEGGLIRLNGDVEGLQFNADDIVIAPRDILEMDDKFMQIIPYVVVMRDGKILSYTRTKKGGESRLHDNVSIGFGGHIDVGDVTTKNDGQEINVESTVANAAQREISEELSIQLDSEKVSLNAVGMIVDRSNPVGRVHVGIVIILDIVDSMVASNEDEIEILGFKTREGLLELESLEGWTQVLLHGGLFV